MSTTGPPGHGVTGVLDETDDRPSEPRGLVTRVRREVEGRPRFRSPAPTDFRGAIVPDAGRTRERPGGGNWTWGGGGGCGREAGSRGGTNEGGSARGTVVDTVSGRDSERDGGGVRGRREDGERRREGEWAQRRGEKGRAEEGQCVESSEGE